MPTLGTIHQISEIVDIACNTVSQIPTNCPKEGHVVIMLKATQQNCLNFDSKNEVCIGVCPIGKAMMSRKEAGS